MPSYDGEYAPKDQRDVTLGKSDIPGEPAKTGPREGETRTDKKENAEGTKSEYAKGADAKDPNAGNDTAKAIPGETAEDPAIRARADAGRPLDGGQ